MESLINIIRNSKLKYVMLIILFTLLVIISAYSYSSAVSNDISNFVFRLHVIANSDTQVDQDLKLIVRDSVLEYVKTKSQNITNKEEMISLLEQYKEQIKQVAEQTIKDNGFSYSVNLNIGTFSFPTKQYGDISFPSGFYDALRIEIGNGDGKNWWCVMFPPLCFVDVSSGIVPENSKEMLEKNLSEEEYLLLASDSSEDLKFKFKILELFNNMKIFTAKK